jgi:hypothetical protein
MFRDRISDAIYKNIQVSLCNTCVFSTLCVFLGLEQLILVESGERRDHSLVPRLRWRAFAPICSVIALNGERIARAASVCGGPG